MRTEIEADQDQDEEDELDEPDEDDEGQGDEAEEADDEEMHEAKAKKVRPRRKSWKAESPRQGGWIGRRNAQQRVARPTEGGTSRALGEGRAAK